MDVSKSELQKILEKQSPGALIFILDRTKELVNIDAIRIFLEADNTDRAPRQAERFDCDDRARRLWGQFAVPGWSGKTIGIAWNERHMFNLFIDEAKEIWAIEPLNDGLLKLREKRGGKYEPKVIVI